MDVLVSGTQCLGAKLRTNASLQVRGRFSDHGRVELQNNRQERLYLLLRGLCLPKKLAAQLSKRMSWSFLAVSGPMPGAPARTELGTQTSFRLRELDVTSIASSTGCLPGRQDRPTTNAQERSIYPGADFFSAAFTSVVASAV